MANTRDGKWRSILEVGPGALFSYRKTDLLSLGRVSQLLLLFSSLREMQGPPTGENDELTKGFQLAQARLSELAHEHRRLVEATQRREHEARMANLTFKELSNLPQETAVFRTVGKSFLISDMSSVKEKLSMVATNALSEREKLTVRLPVLEESIKTAEEKAKSLHKEVMKQVSSQKAPVGTQ